MATSLYLIAPPDAATPTLAATLRAMLAAAPVAALLLRRGTRSDSAYADFVAAIAPLAQGAGCAVLIDGEPALARRLGVDGLHVESSPMTVKAAIAALKPTLIVGAGGVATRHDAMTLGELNLDYIMFGPLSGAIGPETRDLAGWWAETMEIPSVLSDPEVTPTTAETHCEFLAVGDSVWGTADPVATLVAFAATLESAA
jgi:thiamine-phosphate pyrophosphorylase